MSNDPHADRPGDRDWQPPPPPGHGWDPSSLPWGRDDAARDVVRPAGVGKRVGAYIIDTMIVALTISVLALAGLDGGLVPATPEGTDAGSTYISGMVFAALTLAYFVIMEAATGQTLGKRLLRIRATMADGSDMTLEAAFKRRVLFFIGAVVPVAGIANLIGFAVPLTALVTAIQDQTMHQGFHDRWAATRVVDV